MALVTTCVNHKEMATGGPCLFCEIESLRAQLETAKDVIVQLKDAMKEGA